MLAAGRSLMKSRDAVRAGVGVLLCVAGFVLARSNPYRETTVLIDAGGCRMVTDVVDAGNDETQGSVVLLHGVAANKKIMSYLAQAFAQQNLRVFVPDLPGHGRTVGPFSFARADACAGSLVRQLAARKAIDPARTILAGHSMGGAIAVRIAARIPVAGAIAVSPAPMSAAHGVPRDMLLFDGPPLTPEKTLVLSGSWEPRAVRDTARDLAGTGSTTNGKYALIPRATHVSLLFDRRVARDAQEWAAQALHLASDAALPSSQALIGSFVGFAGLLVLAGPFIRETLSLHSPQKTHSGEMDEAPASGANSASGGVAAPSAFRLLVEVGATCLFTVVVLRWWNPLSFVRVFDGGYLASFLLITGIGLLLLHHKSARTLWRENAGTLAAAAFAGLVLHLLVTGWFDATLTEAWLSAARWARFPALFAGALGYLTAEEVLLGPSSLRSAFARLVLALASRLLAWLALVFGVFTLHSGAMLPLLVGGFLAAFSVFQRLGMDVVRRDTGSAMAAALFGAILLSGFCLVIFPIT
jgi:pimeloyl-ACP methyl ester carboxylesterase